MLKTKVPELAQLHPSIQCAVQEIPVSDRYVVALSGGLDSISLFSCALPHLLKIYRPVIQILHVHHGLSPLADDWAKHCLAVSEAQGFACHVEYVKVTETGKGLEAAAREARYAVFERYLKAGGVLLQGHHQDDQTETVLMRLLRGAGPEGLSGMPRQRDLANGQLFRPWLEIPRILLEENIRKNNVSWVEDESNKDQKFDRNFLRHEVLPLLKARWPNVLDSVSRAAVRSGQAHQQLLLWCEGQLSGLMSRLYAADQALDLKALSLYSGEQQRFLVRHWLDGLKVEHPSEKIFERIWSEMIPAERDAMPALRWGKNHLRRFNGCLFYLNDLAVSDDVYSYHVLTNVNDSRQAFSIGGRELNLSIKRMPQRMLNAVLIRAPKPDEAVTIRSRRGGESLVLPGSAQNKSLKKLLQAKKVAPWRRLHLPLIYYGDILALVILSPTESLVAEGFQADDADSALAVNWN